METKTEQFFEDTGAVSPKKEASRIILTASTIAFDFDFVTSDPTKSRADEIRVQLVKNKKPSKRSKEGKPPGIGIPTGQFESKEAAPDAAQREMEDETGCLRRRVIGKLFVINKRLKIDGNFVPNEIHIFLIEASEVIRKVRETDEIDASFEPWVPLRQIFEMPFTQDRSRGSKNPNGIYFSHLQRLYWAIESMVYSPEDLIDGETIKKWLKPNRKALYSAMSDLAKEGLLKKFLPPEERVEETPA